MAEAIKRLSVSDLIVDNLVKRIAEKELRSGDKLPPELELARNLGVSRNSLREAFKRLASLGVLEVRQGEGTFVKNPSVSSTLRAITPLLRLDGQDLQELFEARVYLEKGTARLAALRIDSEELAELEAVVENMEKTVPSDPEAYAQNDFRFHFLIAQASRNSVLKRMLETVSELIRSQQGVVSQTLDLRKLTLEFHREIARALRGQDPLAAEAAMETHLLETQRVLQSG